jgi:hypothetical protein
MRDRIFDESAAVVRTLQTSHIIPHVRVVHVITANTVSY